MSFANRLEQITKEKRSDLALLLRPQMAKLPLPIQRFDDPFLPFSRAVIDAAQAHIVLVMFDLAAYLALGAAGAVALERAIAYAAGRGSLLTVLHGPFATPDYAAATSALAFAPDGVTVTDAALIPAYVLRHQAGVFVASARTVGAAHSTFDATAYRLDAVWQETSIGLRVVGDPVVYSGMGDDYAEAVALGVERLRGEAQ